MNAEATERRDALNSTPGLLALAVLGGLLGYLLAGDVFTAPLRHVAAYFSLGLVGAYLFLQWAEMLAEYLALRRDPVPADLNLGDRTAVQERLGTIRSGTMLESRIRHLLRSWSLGWHPRQVMGLAGFQSAQARNQLYAGTVFALILLVAAMELGARYRWTWAGVILLGITVLARQTCLLRADRYIECRLLAGLPANIPQTAMTAAELARELGGAIQKAFKDYVPQPEQLAAAMRTALDGAMQQVTASVEKLQKSIGEGQGALVEKWNQTFDKLQKGLADSQGALTEKWTQTFEKLQKGLADNQSALMEKWTQIFGGAAADLKGMQEALKTATADLKGGLTAGTEQWQTVLQRHAQVLDKALVEGAGQWKSVIQAYTDNLDKSLAAVPTQMVKAYNEGAGQIVATFKEHAEKVAAASQGLQAQMDRIAQLGKEIEKVLHVQQTVDRALQSVTAAEQLQKTLDVLNRHLDASDKLLREAAKPKVIRLVESDVDAQG